LATSSQDTGEEALQRGLLLRVEHGESDDHAKWYEDAGEYVKLILGRMA
jgi:hypothetical protein